MIAELRAVRFLLAGQAGRHAAGAVRAWRAVAARLAPGGGRRG